MLAWLRAWAQSLMRELLALSIAARDPRTPWPARALAALVLAYALSPFDLIPDFIPVLGYLDDLLLIPAGLWLALCLIPPGVMAGARQQAAREGGRPGKRLGGAVLVVLVYAALLWLAWRWWPGSGAGR